MFQIGLMGYKHKQKIKPSQKISQTVDAISKALIVNFLNFLCSKGQKEVHYSKLNPGMSLFNVSISFNT